MGPEAGNLYRKDVFPMYMFNEAATTAAAAASSEPFIPNSNLIIAGATAVILVLMAVAAFFFLKSHAKNWGNALVYGLLAGVAFIALVPMLLSALITLIPSWAEFMTTNNRANQIISVVLQFVVTCAAFIVGMILLKRSGEKTHQTTDLSSGVMFGFGIFMVELFIGQQLSFCLQYIPFCMSLNDVGYDAAIANAVEQGISEAEAIEQLNSIAAIDVMDYFVYPSIILALKAVLDVCAGALAYGTVTAKFPKAVYALLIGIFAVTFGSNALASLKIFNSLTYIIIIAVLAVLSVVLTVRIVQKYIPDEWDDFKTIKTGSTSGFPRKDKTPPKMPKINMPKE